MLRKKIGAENRSKVKMKAVNISALQEIRSVIANKLTLPLVVLESFKEGKKVENRTIVMAINELKKIVVYLDKKWTLKKKSRK